MGPLCSATDNASLQSSRDDQTSGLSMFLKTINSLNNNSIWDECDIKYVSNIKDSDLFENLPNIITLLIKPFTRKPENINFYFNEVDFPTQVNNDYSMYKVEGIDDVNTIIVNRMNVKPNKNDGFSKTIYGEKIYLTDLGKSDCTNQLIAYSIHEDKVLSITTYVVTSAVGIFEGSKSVKIELDGNIKRIGTVYF